MAKKIRAVLFDCDGVLIDSVQDIADAANTILKKFGFEVLPFEWLCSYVGDGARRLLQRAIKSSVAQSAEAAFDDTIPLPVSDEEFSKIFSVYLEHYRTNAVVKTALYPGIKKALADLKAAGIKTGVVTNKPGPVLAEALKKLEVFEYFDALVTPENANKMKPAPDGIFAALDLINKNQSMEMSGNANPITTGETIMVGDSYVDIESGKAAGALTAAVTRGMGDTSKMLDRKPDLVLDYAAEIANAVILANMLSENF